MPTYVLRCVLASGTCGLSGVLVSSTPNLGLSRHKLFGATNQHISIRNGESEKERKYAAQLLKKAGQMIYKTFAQRLCSRLCALQNPTPPGLVVDQLEEDSSSITATAHECLCRRGVIANGCLCRFGFHKALVCNRYSDTSWTATPAQPKAHQRGPHSVTCAFTHAAAGVSCKRAECTGLQCTAPL